MRAMSMVRIMLKQEDDTKVRETTRETKKAGTR